MTIDVFEIDGVIHVRVDSRIILHLESMAEFDRFVQRVKAKWPEPFISG